MKRVLADIIKRFDLRKAEIVFFLPFLPAIAFKSLYVLIYIPFIMVAILRIALYKRKRMSLIDTVLGLCLYAVILPDNYAVGVIALVLFGIYLREYILNKDHNKLKRWLFRYKVPLIFIAIYLLLNILLNKVPPQNILLEVLYYSTFIVMYIFYTNEKSDYSREINRTLNSIIFIELIYLVIFIPLRWSMIKTQLIGDWSVGTLGTSQGLILVNLYSFAIIKYIHQYFREKYKGYIVIAALCFLGALSTVSVAMTIFFIFSLFVYSLFFMKGIKLKLTFIGVSVLMVFAFIGLSHSWIRDQLYKTITDPTFMEQRVKKIKNFEDTFVTIPSKDLKFAVIGNGMGNYSSRAALTASGYYIKFYNKLGRPYASKYTTDYIHPEIYAQYGVSETDTPTSQYITIMGEFGVIGLLLFCLFLFRLFYKENNINRLTIIYFLCIFMIDNYCEYFKVIMVFYSVYFYVKSTMKFPRS